MSQSSARTRRKVTVQQQAARAGVTVAELQQHDTPAHAQPEVARFLREQPPAPIPPRTRPVTLRGLVALPVLGYRVVGRSHS